MHSVRASALLLLTMALLCPGTFGQNDCRRLCPDSCPLCSFRYAFAQHHLELDCAFAVDAGALTSLTNCLAGGDLNVLIIGRVRSAVRLFSRLSSLPRLIYLNLSRNDLTKLPAGAFAGFAELRDLVLDANQIDDLADGSLAAPKLRRLSLARNRLANISAGAFGSGAANQLTRIDLSQNLLDELTDWPLVLAGRAGPQPTLGRRSLRLLLDHNRVRQFTAERRWPAWTLSRLADAGLNISLVGNGIRHLSRLLNGWHLLDNQPQQRRRANWRPLISSLAGNPLHCDCEDFRLFYPEGGRVSPLAALLKSPAALPECAEPAELRGRRPLVGAEFRSGLAPAELVCRREPCLDSAAGRCRCTEEPWRRTLSVDCRGVTLDRLPHWRELPPLPAGDNYAYRFNFSGGRMANRGLPGMPKVFRAAVSLDLSGTGLEELPARYLAKLQSLEELMLHHNLLTGLDPELEKASFPRLRRLRLDRNPWHCGCNASWLISWLRAQRHTLLAPDDVRCAEPQRLRDRPLLSLSPSALCDLPEPRPANRGYDRLALSSSAISAALALATMALLAAFCGRVSLFASCGLHPFDRDECSGETKSCDAFVMFHPDDADWVAAVLVEKLRRRSRPYALCTHDRARLPGVPAYPAVWHAVESSKRVLTVVTDSFLASVDACTDYQLAVHFLAARARPRRAVRLVHILFPGVRRLPPGLLGVGGRAAAARAVALRYGRRGFWRELFYRMPLRAADGVTAAADAAATAVIDSSSHSACASPRRLLSNSRGIADSSKRDDEDGDDGSNGNPWSQFGVGGSCRGFAESGPRSSRCPMHRPLRQTLTLPRHCSSFCGGISAAAAAAASAASANGPGSSCATLSTFRSPQRRYASETADFEFSEATV